MTNSADLQLILWQKEEPSFHENDWTFNGASTREFTHCFHDYPARMIPQIARKLLYLYGANAEGLFDPYCGTGTSLVEAMLAGKRVMGTDINPLARLVATAKTWIFDVSLLDDWLTRFDKYVLAHLVEAQNDVQAAQSSIVQQVQAQGIDIDFWFKPDVTAKLAAIRLFIDGIEPDDIRRFWQVAFSETVRESSNTRNEEFKLYRYEAQKLDKFNPDVFGIMRTKLVRNQRGLKSFLVAVNALEKVHLPAIYDFNTVQGIPRCAIEPESVDIIITSPPYGDSRTTVAYGQYSRLSAAWIGLQESANIDKRSMGGERCNIIPSFPCPQLNTALEQIAERDAKRAAEVAGFYKDLFSSISNVAELLKVGGYTCYVVGNRKVKGIMLPTDSAVRHFFESCGFQYVTTHYRSIPNKRMPLRNSPTNETGKVDSTMIKESIVVLRKTVR